MASVKIALPVPRHTCHGCGGSCQGVKVRPLPNEVERVHEQAVALGFEQPLVDGVLRQQDGRCIFLDDENSCRIHARWGADAKPRICRQYPFVVLETDTGARVGIDPGCYHAWRSWRTGPPPASEALVLAHNKERPDQEVQAEAALIGLLSTVQTPAQALAQLAAPGIEQRWSALLRSMDRDLLLARTPGPKAGRAIAPLLAAPDPAPAFPDLDPDLAAYTLNAARSFVALRQGDPQLRSIGTTLLMLLGGLAAAWQDQTAETYGEALAGWSRCLRLPQFWTTLISGPEVLQALVGGPARPGVS